ncbi:MAG: putative alpha,2-mannosidase [Pedosphaera sp.]|nr:putative alpha,2-mannosidase [Pedosphaera sp.]
MNLITHRKLRKISAVFFGICFFALRSWAGLPVDDVLPLIGTDGHGHTYPGATVPFGFVQLSPDTRIQTEPWNIDVWDGCSGYHYTDSTILGFSHTHLSGTGCPDLGDLLVMPVTEKLGGSNEYAPLDAEVFKSSFSHENELAQPGYYRVLLARYNILAELSATAHCGMHRYTFPSAIESHILLNLVHGLGNKPVEASLKIENNQLITGYRRSDGWAKNRIIYFAIELSKPFKGFGFEVDGKPLIAGENEVKSKNVRAHLDYETSAGEQITLRVGLSPTSIEEAKKNLNAEMPGWDFDSVRAGARSAWNESLSNIHIESSNPNVRQTFYSALYHSMTAPVLYNDADGSYLGSDKAVHPGSGFQYYSTFSMWDIFRAEAPLMTLAQPQRVNDFVQSMLVSYQQSPDHALPMWPLASDETWCMIGYHSVPIILSAYQKGFRGFDPELAYQAMRDTAMSGRNRQDEYQKLGYVPYVNGKTEATSRTLEFCYDDWCIAQMAKALGKTNDVELFTKRSQNYKTLWDAKTRFFRSKNPDGTFREPFDPKEVASDNTIASGDFTEANAWQYTFAVMHDVPDMINLFGGKEAFISKLDELFNQDSDMPHWRVDVSGLIGQYAQGNEPCHHIPYLYAMAGAQYKTAQRVREIQLTQYSNTPNGICGNDDCGQISAWYVLSAIGLYPINPANGVYVIGSPLVEKATIQLDPKFYKGGSFTVIAHHVSNQNCYIKSAMLNGKPLDHPWITHDQIVSGGTLELEMDILPTKVWGVMN